MGPGLGAAALALALLSAPGGPPPATPGGVFKDVDVVENLNQPIPLERSFTDSTGRTVSLRELLREGKPVVLTLVYYRCPALCGLVLTGTVQALKQAGLALGEDFRAVTVSIDPTETPEMAAERKRGHLQALGLPSGSEAWSFLTGREEDIRPLAEAVGFRYAYDAQLQQYAHAAVIFVLTPEGRLSRYLYGVQYPPRDLRLALVEAAGGRVGTSFDRVLLTCYQYDPATRRYGFFVKGFLRTGGLIIFAALAGLLTVLWRREIKRGTVS